jgi:hypothetical protein
MNRESFLEAVKKHYSEEVHSAFVQCEHGKDIDYSRLTHLISKLRDAAKCEGLPHTDFEDLVKSALPGVWENLRWQPKAA